MSGERKTGTNTFRPENHGFTLLELSLVCAVLAILLSLAMPGYQSYLKRGHRTAAIEQLFATAACQERIYSQDFHYNRSRCLPSDISAYQFEYQSAEPAKSDAFAVVAKPINGQQHDPCGQLKLDQSGNKTISGANDRLRACWQGR